LHWWRAGCQDFSETAQGHEIIVDPLVLSFVKVQAGLDPQGVCGPNELVKLLLAKRLAADA
jgi:hypothetical protein